MQKEIQHEFFFVCVICTNFTWLTRPLKLLARRETWGSNTSTTKTSVMISTLKCTRKSEPLALQAASIEWKGIIRKTYQKSMSSDQFKRTENCWTRIAQKCIPSQTYPWWHSPGPSRTWPVNHATQASLNSLSTSQASQTKPFANSDSNPQIPKP